MPFHVHATRVLPILLLVLPSFACSKIKERVLAAAGDGGSSAASGALPTPVWKDHELSFQGQKGGATFLVSGTKLTMNFRDLPPGMTISSGTQKTTTSTSGYASLAVELVDRLAKLTPRDAFDFKFKFDPQVKVELDYGPAGKLSVDAPPSNVNFGLGDAFKKASDTPVPFPAPVPPPKEHTVLFVGAGSAEPIGPAATVDAIDQVAVVTNLPERKGKVCDGYKASGKNASDKTKSFVLELVDQKVTIYDARSTKSLASKDFKAKDSCPLMAFGGSAKTYPTNDELKAWVREMRGKK